MPCENIFEKMTKTSLVVMLALVLITGRVNGKPAPSSELAAPTIVVTIRPTETAMVSPIVTVSVQEQADVVPTATTFVWATGSNCAGDGINPIGQAIADDYESANYEQVMTWFCNGAEFDDIMVALETEAQTNATANDMLKMLSDGFTWDEIWQDAGLVQ